jgi:RNA polymerase sigma factor (sigma-70 family)
VSKRDEIERVYSERFASYVGAAAGIVGSRELGRDAVQDAFERALKHQGRFKGGSLEAWIWRIVLNRARDIARRPVVAELADAEAVTDDSTGGPLAAAVLGLSEQRRTVVLLRYVVGLRNTEIAEALGISPGTVAATLSQAREVLGEVLEREGRAG